MEIPDFCRQIETYLCKKNDGHLIRVVGPSFELVSGWAAQGIPLKVAFAGIDRYFERYYRNGPRRRPVKIDFCEADVLDVFDEWRRATGIGREPVPVREPHGSLVEHLKRVVTRLTSARASGAIGAEFDALIDEASNALDSAAAKPGGLRGDARRQLVERLSEIDRSMMELARAHAAAPALRAFEQEAELALAPFRFGMAADAYAQARAAAVDQLVREHLNLPTVAFDQR